MAQNPPMAFPVIDEGVCVPYPTKTRKKIKDMNEYGPHKVENI